MKKYQEKRKWGNFTQYTHNEISTVKILEVTAGQRLSLQYHNHREEFWLFLDNPANVTLGKKIIRATKGKELFIKKKQLHRIQALDKPVRVLEISFGKFDENDIVRIEDDYGRT